MQVALGTYVGDGTSDRAITGIGFVPDLVLIKVEGRTQNAVWKSAEMPAGRSAYLAYGVAGLVTQRIESLDADGFTIGNQAAVNSSGYTYHWLAIRDDGAGDFATGSFAGDGTDDRSITGLGFTPDMVWAQNENMMAAWTTSDAEAGYSHFFSTTIYQQNIIQQLISDGFEVGSSNYANQSGETIYWAAWKKISGLSTGGMYTGNGVDDRSITGFGGQPNAILLKCELSAPPAIWRPSTVAGDLAFAIDTTIQNSNRIQALESDGFQLGTSTYVNGNGWDYLWWGFAEGSSGPEQKSASDSLSFSESLGDRSLGGGDALAIGEALGDRTLGTADSVGVGESSDTAEAHTGSDSLTLAESSSITMLKTGSDALTLGESASAVTTSKLSDQLQLEVDVTPRVWDRVEVTATVFFGRIEDTVNLEVNVVPLLTDRVALEMIVRNQSLETASEAAVIAPDAEVTFL